LRDIDQTAVERGRQSIERNLAKGIERGKVTEAQRDETLARIAITNRIKDLSAADLIIEAAPENLELKQNFVARMRSDNRFALRLGHEHFSLSITEIASDAARPEKVIGMHFFNPVHIIS
jgi:3-hydroxybutyryl-CoA dehydrogenase